MSSVELRSWKVAAAVSVIFGSSAIATLLWNELKAKKKRPEKWIRVGTVENIVIYPVKSFKGVQVQEANAAVLGLQGSTSELEFLRDRVFLVVNSKGTFQRVATLPKMCLITATVKNNTLTLSAAGMDTITIEIPSDKKELRRSCKLYEEKIKTALDCGDEVGNWLSRFLGKESLRLYYHDSTVTMRTELSLSQKRFAHFSPFDKGTFQDETSYMIITTESLKALNDKLLEQGEKPITAAYIRPSIVISGTSEPFSEDFWSFIRIGPENGPIFKASQPCLRCKVTTLDPETGTFNLKGEPLKTLHAMKRNLWNEEMDKICKNQAIFGLHLGLYEPSERALKVGDAVYAAVL